VKMAEIRHRQAQIIKIKDSLGQPGVPLHDITRPKGMRRLVFRKKLRRIVRHENEITRLLLEGSSNTLKRGTIPKAIQRR